jgi:hypothetical protein
MRQKQSGYKRRHALPTVLRGSPTFSNYVERFRAASYGGDNQPSPPNSGRAGDVAHLEIGGTNPVLRAVSVSCVAVHHAASKDFLNKPDVCSRLATRAKFCCLSDSSRFHAVCFSP